MRIAPPPSWLATTLTLALLAAFVKAFGAFAPATYRDPVWTASQLRGADVVALFTLVPLLLLSAAWARRGAPRGVLLWLGALHVLVYDVAFYLFGAAFNAWFLAYAALVAGGLVLLVAALYRLDLDALGRAFDTTTPHRWPAAVLALLGLGLGGVWASQAVAYLATGTLPSSVVASGHPTAVVFAIDLTLLVPFFLFAAAGLWRRSPWGRVLAAAVSVSGATYTMLLAGMGLGADPAVVEGASVLVPLWLALGAASAAVAVTLLRHAPSRPG
jgi:hypothetical protein